MNESEVAGIVAVILARTNVDLPFLVVHHANNPIVAAACPPDTLSPPFANKYVLQGEAVHTVWYPALGDRKAWVEGMYFGPLG